MRRIPTQFCVFALCAVLTTHAAVVTTTDNASTPGDGQTSLLEALTAVTAGETISFNIPGPGPHVIVTPETGYPLITAANVTIDGHTQPGAQPNTAGPAAPRNAVLKIVLDSRTPTPAARRTVLTGISGFGSNESCVLGFRSAPGGQVRGLAFLNVGGVDDASDPYVYCVAFIEQSPNGKVQGCWFGIAPGVEGVHGARSAVASFRQAVGIHSGGLIFGVDGDGSGDAGEGNVCVGQRLAVHLETPNARVSGNWFNQFPDGTFLDPTTLTLEDGTLEAIENGDGANMIIGTNADGVSDAHEGNRFGPVVYTEFALFWRAAHGVVFAGNTIGLDLLGLPAFVSTGDAVLFARKDSSFRIGSNMDGVNDAAEANRIYGLGDPFIRWHNNNNDANGKPARISVRRNELIACAGRVPVSQNVLVTTQRVFVDAMLDPSQAAVVLSPASTVAQLAGTVPLPAAGVAAPVLDLYHGDGAGYFAGAPQGRVWLGSFAVDGAGDLDLAPGQFAFDVSVLALSPLALGRLTATATYTLADGRIVTTNFAAPIVPPGSALPLADFRISRSGASALLEWTGGIAPFRLITATDLAGPWSDLATISAQTFTTPLDAPQRFYRLSENAQPPPSAPMPRQSPRKKARAAK